MPLLEHTSKGIYCSKGNFYIDAHKPVETCIVTHAHSDHSKAGHDHYISSPLTAKFIRERLGNQNIETHSYNTPFSLNDVTVSLHPAGHILGSAQVKIQYKDETWVVTGDFNNTPNRAAEQFTQLTCDNLITEATFGLPIYKWKDEAKIFHEMKHWIQQNKEKNQTTILLGYGVGKSQRILNGLSSHFDETILLHGAVTPYNKYYEEAGIDLGNWTKMDYDQDSYEGRIVIAPPNAYRTNWMNNFKNPKTAFCSGWMTIRGKKRRKGYDKGFVLSDHADWDGLLRYVETSTADNIYLTHGDTDSLKRYINEHRDQTCHDLNEL